MAGKINSRVKGCRGEREACEVLRSFGIKARRGQQFSGSPDSPDVVSSLEGWHIEVKRVESFNAYKALEQAVADGGGARPLVMHKKNGKPWLVVCLAQDVLPLLAGSVPTQDENVALRGAQVANPVVCVEEEDAWDDL